MEFRAELRRRILFVKKINEIFFEFLDALMTENVFAAADFPGGHDSAYSFSIVEVEKDSAALESVNKSDFRRFHFSIVFLSLVNRGVHYFKSFLICKYIYYFAYSKIIFTNNDYFLKSSSNALHSIPMATMIANINRGFI